MKKIILLLAIAAGTGFLISKTGPANKGDGTPMSSGKDTHQSSENTLSATKPTTSHPVRATPSNHSKSPYTEKRANLVQTDMAPSDSGSSAPPSANDDGPSDKKGVASDAKDNWKERFNEAEKLLKQKKLVKARNVLSQLYVNGAETIKRQARDRLEEINSSLVFDPQCVEGATLHTVEPGETLASIGQKYGINWRCIQRVNNISRPELLRAGQQLKVLAGPRKILVAKSNFKLVLFIDDYFVKEYPIGLGKNNKTPTGTFRVDSMLIKPVWYPPGGGRIEYGDEGYLIGDRWIGLEDKPGAAGYGIHGTNDPSSIGKQVSEGCIRMHNEDVVELFDFINVGTTIKIME